MYNDCILTAEQAKLSIRRIAYQIYEDNTNEKRLVIAGVMSNGNQVAKSIAKVLRSISDIEVIDCKIHIDKKNPQNKIQTSIDKLYMKTTPSLLLMTYYTLDQL